MTTIVIDGLNEEDFRRSIENRLREGRPGVAIERLRGLLATYAGQEKILPERFLTVEASDLDLQGWDVLGDAIGKHDRPGSPVTAVSIAFGWQGEEQSEGASEVRSKPHVETSYFTDAAFPFSRCGREDLLEGYSSYGCNWAGDAEATDAALSVEGIDDLHGALAELEAHLLASDEPDEDGIRAGSLRSCLLSSLLFQAVAERIGRDGLPRPICVMAGSNDVYPYFDAPVAGIPEDARKASEAEVVEAEAGQSVPAPRYSSLLMTSIPHARKRAVLVLEESDDQLADRIAELRSIRHEESQDGQGPSAARLPAASIDAEGAACNSPLLVKKSDRKDGELPELLGPLGERRPAPNEQPQHLLCTSAFSGDDASVPVSADQQVTFPPIGPARVEDVHAVLSENGRMAEGMAPCAPVEQRSRLSVRSCWRGILKLANVAARFRAAGRGDTRGNSARKRPR